MNSVSQRLYLIASAVVILLVVLIACKKNFSGTNTNPGGPSKNHGTVPTNAIIASINGRIMDTTGRPIGGVLVSSANGSTTTDINGQFALTNTNFDQYGAYIRVTKDGYFDGSRTMQIAAGSTNYTEIEMIILK